VACVRESIRTHGPGVHAPRLPAGWLRWGAVVVVWLWGRGGRDGSSVCYLEQLARAERSGGAGGGGGGGLSALRGLRLRAGRGRFALVLVALWRRGVRAERQGQGSLPLVRLAHGGRSNSSRSLGAARSGVGSGAARRGAAPRHS
jgi:hypothetical protein